MLTLNIVFVHFSQIGSLRAHFKDSPQRVGVYVVDAVDLREAGAAAAEDLVHAAAEAGDEDQDGAACVGRLESLNLSFFQANTLWTRDKPEYSGFF